MENLTDEQLIVFKMSTPIPLTNLMHKRPCCFLSIGFALMLIISVIVAWAGWLMPNLPTDRDYVVWGDPYVTNFDKTQLVASELGSIYEGDQAKLQSQLVTEWTAIMIYNGKDDQKGELNLWTKDTLIKVREQEKKAKALDTYAKTCLAQQVVGSSDPD